MFSISTIGVVDQHADHQRQREQRDRVEREAEQVDRAEGRDDRQRQRDRGEHGRTPVAQEPPHDPHREQRAFEQQLHRAAVVGLDRRDGVARLGERATCGMRLPPNAATACAHLARHRSRRSSPCERVTCTPMIGLPSRRTRASCARHGRIADAGDLVEPHEAAVAERDASWPRSAPPRLHRRPACGPIGAGRRCRLAHPSCRAAPP